MAEQFIAVYLLMLVFSISLKWKLELLPPVYYVTLDVSYVQGFIITENIYMSSVLTIEFLIGFSSGVYYYSTHEGVTSNTDFLFKLQSSC